MMFRANFAWIATEDEHVLDQARVGVKNVLARAQEVGPPEKRPRPRKR
jgi:hypothetical protein